MTVSDGFFLGLAFAAAFGTLAASLAHRIATRVQSQRERRRRDQEVRLAFVKLASQMREAERRTRIKQDMPWPDRLKEAQIGQLVNLGIWMPKVVVHG